VPLANTLAVVDPAAGVGLAAAFAAGVVSFLSPCVLPLVPGYLSAVSGLKPDELETAGWRRVVLPSLVFIASFSAVFILLGLTATRIGGLLTDNRALLEDLAGGLMIAMGILFVAAGWIDSLNREWRPSGLIDRAGTGGPLVAGIAFAIAWTPCIGPTLGAILSAAAVTDSAGRGALLLAVYSLGLGLPFLLSAIGFGRMTEVLKPVRRHYGIVIGIGGLILIGMGVLVLTGELFRLNIEIQQWLESLGLDFWNSV
jgi:cytochrome c-type biogenesis protein